MMLGVLVFPFGGKIQNCPFHCCRDQLFACGYPVAAAQDLGKIFKSGEAVRCRVRGRNLRLQVAWQFDSAQF